MLLKHPGKAGFKSIFIFLFLILISCNLLIAQPDTLSIAGQFDKEGRYDKAESLLSKYLFIHSSELNTLWLYAQSAYWNGNFKKSNQAYEKAIALFPSNRYLQLDFANKLNEQGEFRKAAQILKDYKNFDSTSVGYKTALAKQEFYKANYTGSRNKIKEILNKEPGNITAIELNSEIKNATSQWVRLSAGYQKDDQPLKSLPATIETGKYFNHWFSPELSASATSFKLDGTKKSAQNVQAGNKFIFPSIGLKATLRAGISFLPDHTTSWSVNAELEKALNKTLTGYLFAGRSPYFNTVSSITQNIIPYQYKASFSYNKKLWSVKINFEYNDFAKDKNCVYSVNGWALTRPLRFSSFALRAGYAYNFSDANKNNFSALNSINVIEAGYSDNSFIEGIYNPYFTPHQQVIHSALASLNFTVTEKFSGGVNFNYGFGTTQQPYLFLNSLNNETIIDRGFSKLSYHPVELNAFLNYRFSQKVSSGIYYNYLHNDFYTNHYVLLTFSTVIFNEK